MRSTTAQASDPGTPPVPFKDRFWRDAQGKVVIGQMPNLPLIAWLVLTVGGWPLRTGAWHNGITFTGSGFLFVWAYLEAARGVDYFRRLLGVTVLLVSVAAHIH